MNILKIFKKKDNIDNEKIYTRVLYNSRYNFIELISYSSKQFYDAIELLSAINKISKKYTGMNIIISHSAKERELTEEEQQDFDIKKVDIIDNRYYLLISGSPEEYANIFYHIDLSNEIFKAIIEDIYQYCSSPYFKEYIDYGIIDFNKFKYKNIAPKYDKYIELKHANLPSNKTFWADDINKIIDALPECFYRIDLANIIKIYTSEDGGKHVGNFTNMQQIVEYAELDDPRYSIFKTLASATSKPLFSKIINEPCRETLNILTSPLFMREDLEDLYSGNMPTEELDIIFQQEYDRFTQVTADFTQYEDIDEQLADDEETQNMRAEDMILNDTNESV